MRMKSLAIIAALALSTAIAGCSTIGGQIFSNDYGAVTDAGYQLPRIPIEKVPRQFHRQEVNYDTKEKPGTIIVDNSERQVPLSRPRERPRDPLRHRRRPRRLQLDMARPRSARKTEWPTWTPPREMIRRQPEAEEYAPMACEPGLKNPLGARAMYLFNKGGDMGYRLHGSPEWNSDRQGRLVGLRAPDEPGHHRSL